MSHEFDSHSAAYRAEIERSIRFSGRDLDFFTAPKAEYLANVARLHLGHPSTLEVLDVGCGTGETDRFLVDSFGAVRGVDVSAQMVERATATNPSVQYEVYGGDVLPYATGRVDVAFMSCVLHHVPQDEQQRLVDEMRRVTRSPGLVVLIEHNPLNPLTRLAVHRCAFDVDVKLMPRRRSERLLRTAGLDVVDTTYLLLFPWRARPFQAIERVLRSLPFGAQYAMAGFARSAEAP